LNKFLLIITVIAGIAVGLILSYALKIPFAVAVVDTIKAKIASINIGGVNIGSIASIAGILGTAGTAYGLYGQYKGKIEAQAQNAKQLLDNKNTYEELTNVTNLKTSLEDKLSEATQLKNEALQTLETKTQEFQGLTDEVSLLQDKLEEKEIKIDTLTDALRRIKLEKGEVIEKIIVK